MNPAATLDPVATGNRSGETRSVAAPVVAPPPLMAGDRLTRFEFHRRYEAMPHIGKAELVEGVVYMPSPLRIEYHAEPHAGSSWQDVKTRLQKPSGDTP